MIQFSGIDVSFHILGQQDQTNTDFLWTNFIIMAESSTESFWLLVRAAGCKCVSFRSYFHYANMVRLVYRNCLLNWLSLQHRIFFDVLIVTDSCCLLNFVRYVIIGSKLYITQLDCKKIFNHCQQPYCKTYFLQNHADTDIDTLRLSVCNRLKIDLLLIFLEGDGLEFYQPPVFFSFVLWFSFCWERVSDGAIRFFSDSAPHDNAGFVTPLFLFHFHKWC